MDKLFRLRSNYSGPVIKGVNNVTENYIPSNTKIPEQSEEEQKFEEDPVDLIDHNGSEEQFRASLMKLSKDDCIRYYKDTLLRKI